MLRSGNVYRKLYSIDERFEIEFIILKEIRIDTIFGIAKIQLRFRLQNRIIIGDFWEVNRTLNKFIFGMKSNPSRVSGRNERVYCQNEDSGLSAVF